MLLNVYTYNGIYFLYFVVYYKYIYKNVSYLDSNIHAIITFVVSTLYLCGIPLIQYYYLKIMLLSVFYCILDIKNLILNKPKGYLSLLFHHLIIIVVTILVNTLFNNSYITKHLFALNYLTEISTPILNKTLLLKDTTLKKKYSIYKKLLFCTFFLSRVLGGAYFLYTSFLTYNYYIFLSQLSLTTLNIVWFYKIVQYF